MTLTNEYLMGFRDDKPTRFHDILQVEKAQSMANAAMLYSASNPALAESLMGMIKFQHEVGRKEYQAHLQAGSSEATLKSISGRNKIIEHIHKNCYEEIVSSWKPLTIEQTNEKFLEDMREKYKGKEGKLIGILIDSIKEDNEKKPSLEDWLNTKGYVLELDLS